MAGTELTDCRQAIRWNPCYLIRHDDGFARLGQRHIERLVSKCNITLQFHSFKSDRS